MKQSYKGHPLLLDHFFLHPHILTLGEDVVTPLKQWLDSRDILRSDFMLTNPEHYVVDIKYHKLKKGQVPCTRPFHQDTVGGKPRGDCTYWMWMNNTPTTSFYKGPETAVRPSIDTPNQTQVPVNTWGSYTDFDWHRGTEALEDCERLFLRILHCHRVKGSIQPYEVTIT